MVRTNPPRRSPRGALRCGPGCALSARSQPLLPHLDHRELVDREIGRACAAGEPRLLVLGQWGNEPDRKQASTRGPPVAQRAPARTPGFPPWLPSWGILLSIPTTTRRLEYHIRRGRMSKKPPGPGRRTSRALNYIPRSLFRSSSREFVLTSGRRVTGATQARPRHCMRLARKARSAICARRRNRSTRPWRRSGGRRRCARVSADMRKAADLERFMNARDRPPFGRVDSRQHAGTSAPASSRGGRQDLERDILSWLRSAARGRICRT